MTETKTYTGGCHCGAVKYEVDLALETVNQCNCSHCRRKGFLLAFAPASSFRLISGDDAQTEYRFNKKTIEHLFCKTCGVQSFGRGEMPSGPVVAINVRCLEGVDANALEIKAIDGASL
ncbi:MAG: GFA family protein [Maricaulaceae bacterium]|jgi:hypothetical protein